MPENGKGFVLAAKGGVTKARQAHNEGRDIGNPSKMSSSSFVSSESDTSCHSLSNLKKEHTKHRTGFYQEADHEVNERFSHAKITDGGYTYHAYVANAETKRNFRELKKLLYDKFYLCCKFFMYQCILSFSRNGKPEPDLYTDDGMDKFTDFISTLMLNERLTNTAIFVVVQVDEMSSDLQNYRHISKIEFCIQKALEKGGHLVKQAVSDSTLWLTCQLQQIERPIEITENHILQYVEKKLQIHPSFVTHIVMGATYQVHSNSLIILCRNKKSKELLLNQGNVELKIAGSAVTFPLKEYGNAASGENTNIYISHLLPSVGNYEVAIWLQEYCTQVENVQGIGAERSCMVSKQFKKHIDRWSIFPTTDPSTGHRIQSRVQVVYCEQPESSINCMHCLRVGEHVITCRNAPSGCPINDQR